MNIKEVLSIVGKNEYALMSLFNHYGISVEEMINMSLASKIFHDLIAGNNFFWLLINGKNIYFIGPNSMMMKKMICIYQLNTKQSMEYLGKFTMLQIRHIL